ncbi:LLM class flavin-dependent oxidoreductase [Paenibacillus sp. FSL H7-0331]|uniref:LLM class flavin-dependent oxidoreductase n=1 Tax=Paenibacillus sp. FSL H7-0331 TaxID=1920421 RepID=UPI00096C880E|nr:LLM class flavin-dependent oxidoreductase [Paenibacillus sp. FSL H7-0331]OMF11597.1 5,10-methylene tetrahydromethanopterin reductase [Paenibacillus sp. FSL H7-0331]
MAKRMRLNAVEMANPVQDNAGLWLYPGNRVERYKDLDYWIELAQTLERGKFDALFFADILGVYDVYQGSRDTAVREGMYFPINDPSYAIPAMAAATEHLGFVLTASLSYEHPYALARKMSTLDHLTDGRLGWNMVMSNLDSTARNYGLEQLDHDERYNRGDEYLEVCHKLWEESWEDGAVVRDRINRIYADPAKVHEIGHEGKYFKVPGIHLCEPSPQRTPVLFQAGSSDRGREFAAKHAECIFLNAMTENETKFLVQDIRQRAERYGRNPEEVLFFPKINPVIGATEVEAQQELHNLLAYSSPEGALSLLSVWTGVDFSTVSSDELLAFIRKGEQRSGTNYLFEFFKRNGGDEEWGIEQLSKYFAFGGVGSLRVGTPEQIADQLEQFMDHTGVDGYNIAYATRSETFEQFVSKVVPVLQHRGRVQNEYATGVFRHKLLG